MADATNKVYYCPVEVVIDLLGSKWKPSVLRQLHGGIETVGELQQSLPLITRNTLDLLLGDLARDGLVEKTLHSDHRGREAYSLTEAGARLGPILEDLASLGTAYAVQHGIELLDDGAKGSVSSEGEEAARWEAWSWLPL